MVRRTKAQILQEIEDARIQREANQDRQELHSALQRLGIPANPPNISFFEEVAIPGKGLGIRAVIDIPKGTPILAEEAFFSVLDADADVPNQYRRRKAFSDLFCTEARDPQKRFEENYFQMNGPERGIFLRASRFNHSCRPNAYFAWDPRSQRITINAILDIRTDDEVCLNHIAKFFAKSRSERHRKLRHYDFTCQCPACLPDSEFGSASVERRKKMKALEAQLDRNETASKQRLLDIDHFELLLKQEGLVYPRLAGLCRLKASWYMTEMSSATSQGMTNLEYRRFCRNSALQAAKDELDLDITANGHDSPVVDRAVEFIREIGRE